VQCDDEVLQARVVEREIEGRTVEQLVAVQEAFAGKLLALVAERLLSCD